MSIWSSLGPTALAMNLHDDAVDEINAVAEETVYVDVATATPWNDWIRLCTSGKEPAAFGGLGCQCLALRPEAAELLYKTLGEAIELVRRDGYRPEPLTGELQAGSFDEV